MDRILDLFDFIWFLIKTLTPVVIGAIAALLTFVIGGQLAHWLGEMTGSEHLFGAIGISSMLAAIFVFQHVSDYLWWKIKKRKPEGHDEQAFYDHDVM